MRRPVIGVMGAGRPSGPTLGAARELGRLLAEQGWIVLTGGRPVGIMAAAAAGAKEIRGSITLGILPGASEDVGPDIDVAVFTAMGDARNAINVLTSDVVVACGVEGPGTASEVSLALKAGKPVILLSASPAAGTFFRSVAFQAKLWEASDPQQVVTLIQKLGVAQGAAWAP